MSSIRAWRSTFTPNVLPRPLQRQRFASVVDSFQYSSRDEERIVRTTLHDVGTQLDSMKLSLKIYHFQELSRTTLSDRQLKRDPRYAKLKDDLQQNVKELSPSQVVAGMVSAGRLRLRDRQFWWDLARAAERHVIKTRSGASGLQHSQICLALFSLGKARVKVKERFYYRMLRFMLFRAELWTEYDMAWILSAMRRRKLKALKEDSQAHRLWGKVQRNIAAYFNQKVRFISPQGLVFILYEFACIGVYPGPVVFRAARRIRQHMPDLSDKALVALASTLARFDWPNQRLLRKISQEVQTPRRFVRLDPALLVVVLHAFAKLRVRDLSLLEAITGVMAKGGAEKLDAKSQAMLAYSFGLLGVRGLAWEPLARRIEDRIDRHSPLHLGLIAHAFGKVGIRDQAALSALSSQALLSIQGFSPKMLVCLLDGLMLVNCLNEDLLTAAFEEYIRLSSTGNRQREQMMSRILFSIVLEKPSTVTGASDAWRALLDQARISNFPSRMRPYHEELSDCAKALSLTATVYRRKGPYTADLYVSTPEGSRPLAVHLVASAEVCPLTGELLGPTRMRQRHLSQMGWVYLGLHRAEWRRLRTGEERVDALEALLSRYVQTRRRPFVRQGEAALEKLEGSSSPGASQIAAGEKPTIPKVLPESVRRSLDEHINVGSSLDKHGSEAGSG